MSSRVILESKERGWIFSMLTDQMTVHRADERSVAVKAPPTHLFIRAEPGVIEQLISELSDIIKQPHDQLYEIDADEAGLEIVP